LLQERKTKIEVFNSILLGEQSLWAVVAVFYVLDNLKQLSGNKLLFYENCKLTWRISVPSDALVFLNKQVALLNILLPHTLTIPVEWLTPEPCNPSQIRRADRVLRVSQRKMFSFRWISAICFFAFFVEGPLLTYSNGLTYALLHIGPIYGTGLAMLSFTLLVDRRFWHLSVAQIIATLFEAAICPAYLVNVTHRMSWKHIRIDADGGAYALSRCQARSRDDLKSALSFALEELEQKLANNTEERQRLIAYRESILR
jgi:hypothetical protein